VKWRCFDVVNEEKLDTRPAEECAGVAPAGEELRRAKLNGRACDHLSS
jgi:hypothetical protein